MRRPTFKLHAAFVLFGFALFSGCAPSNPDNSNDINAGQPLTVNSNIPLKSASISNQTPTDISKTPQFQSTPKSAPDNSVSQSTLIITDIKNAPIEYQLTYLDTEKLPRGDDIKAARIRFLLKTLAQKTGDTEQHIADRTGQSVSILKKDYGKEATNLKFLEEAHSYFASRGPKTNFDDLSILLVMAMSQ